MAAIGIDLGSELTTVATLMKSNKPGGSSAGRKVCILPNEAGELTTASVTPFGDVPCSWTGLLFHSRETNTLLVAKCRTIWFVLDMMHKALMMPHK